MRLPQSPSFYILTLGCPKNMVDSHGMMQLLKRAGYRPATGPATAQIIIVNTCGFIAPARDESLRTLQELAAAKRPRQRLIAAGCLAQRWGRDLSQRIPGLDGIIGVRHWMDITALTQRLRLETPPAPICHQPSPTAKIIPEPPDILRAAPQGASAYLKIADGCRRRCAFCAIPLIKGTAVSRPPATILEDARRLADAGIRELVLIAQDTTDYGHDLGLVDGLPQLLEQLVRTVPTIDWLRLLYAYPTGITDRLIAVMAAHPQIVPYLDLPLQHAHPDILRRMRRPANLDRLRRTIGKMRAALPNLALRSAFIVGYPGETEAEFQTLADFVAAMQFDRVGVFTYSPEDGTLAAVLGDPVPEVVKQERRARLMELQQTVSLAKNRALIGQTLAVLVEGCGEGISAGRSYRDAPEIDGLVILNSEAPVGAMVKVRITGAMVYDLTGTIVKT